MRIVTVGLGLRAVSVLERLQAHMPEAEVVAYVDPTPYQKTTHKNHEALKAYDTLEDMLANEEADLLFVGSPNHLHLDHIRTGLNAGIRIFAEKPVVISMDETMELAQLLSKHGADQVLVGLVLRYAQHARDLRAAQAAGLIGEVVSIEANEHIAPYHGAFFMRDWRRYTKYSGGFMLEKCCHDLDIYNMVTGSRPIRVASFGGRKSFIPDNAPARDVDTQVYHQKESIWEATQDPFLSDGDIVDHQTAILEYESGASMAFHTNMNVPDEQRRFCVMGTKGMAEGDYVRGYLKVTQAHSRNTVVDEDYTKSIDRPGAHYGADDMMCQDLCAYLRGELKSLPVSVVDALEAGVAALALDQARMSKQVVDLTSYWEKFDSFNLRGGTAATNTAEAV
ncbi:putative oxidoreductase YteT precursor [Pseudovibrio axinellae]|uniref:Putative oxidoreductase YteT n=1 Tax=Pseudovibrio axinellae TaxID=989403 RepID=A0A165T4W5_9HYPH|nr:Gfo/Idh/MocA family oxidoreductase [Pseudovibrio axinellae]KZL05435.1 putative oxidoreductase YteT precursor [Pseudovibrio axinellae]SEP99334.1 Predicted dehydrogenase [Pseudovibrio axinellae]